MAGAVEGDTFIGKKAQELRGLLRIRYPMEHGIVTNWDDMERIWQHVYTEELKTLSEEAVLALYASGRTTGIVLDSGDGVTHAVPVYEGFAMPHAIRRIDVAGRDVTESLQLQLRKAGHHLHTTAEKEIVRIMKEKCCYVALNPSAEEKEAGARFDEYVLPDGKVIKLGPERFRAPEILFNPELIGLEYVGIHQVVVDSINKADMDLRKALFSNIVLSGGSTLCKGFGDRLLNEVKKLALKDIKIKIFAPPERKRDDTVVAGGCRCITSADPTTPHLSSKNVVHASPVAATPNEASTDHSAKADINAQATEVALLDLGEAESVVAEAITEEAYQAVSENLYAADRPVELPVWVASEMRSDGGGGGMTLGRLRTVDIKLPGIPKVADLSDIISELSVSKDGLVDTASKNAVRKEDGGDVGPRTFSLQRPKVKHPMDSKNLSSGESIIEEPEKDEVMDTQTHNLLLLPGTDVSPLRRGKTVPGMRNFEFVEDEEDMEDELSVDEERFEPVDEESLLEEESKDKVEDPRKGSKARSRVSEVLSEIDEVLSPLEQEREKTSTVPTDILSSRVDDEPGLANDLMASTSLAAMPARSRVSEVLTEIDEVLAKTIGPDSKIKVSSESQDGLPPTPNEEQNNIGAVEPNLGSENNATTSLQVDADTGSGLPPAYDIVFSEKAGESSAGDTEKAKTGLDEEEVKDTDEGGANPDSDLEDDPDIMSDEILRRALSAIQKPARGQNIPEMNDKNLEDIGEEKAISANVVSNVVETEEERQLALLRLRMHGMPNRLTVNEGLYPSPNAAVNEVNEGLYPSPNADFKFMSVPRPSIGNVVAAWLRVREHCRSGSGKLKVKPQSHQVTMSTQVTIPPSLDFARALNEDRYQGI
ncbi:hypothetical protein HDU96_009103 [Phlyctochytrium bullatum]|nr:hypothetical protein HDU96_009103 [Phlyctochytrium bullatum]